MSHEGIVDGEFKLVIEGTRWIIVYRLRWGEAVCVRDSRNVGYERFRNGMVDLPCVFDKWRKGGQNDETTYVVGIPVTLMCVRLRATGMMVNGSGKIFGYHSGALDLS